MKYQQYEVQFTRGKKGTVGEDMVKISINGKYNSWLAFYHKNGTLNFDNPFYNKTLINRIKNKCQQMLVV